MFEQPPKPVRIRWQAFTLFGGVILPAISIAVEATTHICAEHFFDPIPTVWHLLLVIFVPLAHLQAWFSVIKGQAERGALLGLTNAIAIGISVFYTIVYVPLLPLGLIFLPVLLGFLPLAPPFALISGLVLRRQLGKVVVDKSFALSARGLVTGLVLGLGVIALVELPVSLTRIGLQMAASESPERRAKGLRWLRTVGDKNYLLRACYGRTGRATDLVGYLFSLPDPVAPEDARKIYYRLTGETFNTSAPPMRVADRWVAQDSVDFDPDQGGTIIAGKVKGLSLSGSRIDGLSDADAGHSYLEWTLNFKNDSPMPQEARSEVQLPPGGFVSRLTLWVNGEEREAAFAGRSQARQAYQQVAIVQRRDPVLVTTAGRDRILVQCFPVGAGGGEMKVRIGITTPLVLEDPGHARLLLPHFRDRNFRIPDGLKHAVWIESQAELQSDSKSLKAEQPAANLHAVRGALPDTELLQPESTVRMLRSQGITQVWTRSRSKGDGEIIRQFIREKPVAARARVVLVIDTSRAMQASAREISAALRALPADLDLTMLLADGNGAYEEGASQKAIKSSAGELASELDRVTFTGGADNVPALVRAWDLAAQNPGSSAIVWIHSPQLLELRDAEELRQRWERRPNGPALYAIQTGQGPDRIEEKLDGVSSVESVPRLGRLQSDLEKLFAQLSGRSTTLEFVRSSQQLEKLPDAPDTRETSAHLARIWANDEVRRLMIAKDEKSVAEAIQLAVAYQLVTPVSGAVVLETQEQYTAAGLKPVSLATVPTIPEPEMVMLIAIVAAFLLWLLCRRYFSLVVSSRSAS